MNRILTRALIFTFVVGLSSAYVVNVLWACGGECDGSEQSSHGSDGHVVQAKAEVKGEKAEAVKDPVCGMEVKDIKKAQSEKHDGKVYYFCSEHCKNIFKKDPASYGVKETHQHGEGEGHKH